MHGSQFITKVQCHGIHRSGTSPLGGSGVRQLAASLATQKLRPHRLSRQAASGYKGQGDQFALALSPQTETQNPGLA